MNLRFIERLLEQLALLGIEWHQQLARALSRQPIGSGEKCRQHCRVRLVLDVLEELMLAREELAGTDTHPRNAGIVAVARKADHIAIAAFDLEHDGRFL